MIRLPDGYDWTVDIDEVWPGEPPSLILFLIDETTGEPCDALGGVDVRFWVSDHGNIHIDPDSNDYLQELLNEMIVIDERKAA